MCLNLSMWLAAFAKSESGGRSLTNLRSPTNVAKRSKVLRVAALDPSEFLAP